MQKITTIIYEIIYEIPMESPPSEVRNAGGVDNSCV